MSQLIKFIVPAAAGTVTAKKINLSTDAVIETTSTVSVSTNGGIYTATFSDATTGTFLFRIYDDGVAFASAILDIDTASGTWGDVGDSEAAIRRIEDILDGITSESLGTAVASNTATFTVYKDEAASISGTVVDSDSLPVDLTTHTLSFVLSTIDDVYIATISSISVSGVDSNVYTLTLPNTYTQSLRAIKYALRSASANVVLAKGLISVEPASDA